MAKFASLNVNGQRRQVEAEPETSLLEVLRNDLGLTGAKYGCGEAQCGACTVLVEGAVTRACITSLKDVGAKPVTTIEALETGTTLHPLQQAFIDEDAMQCGYCTTGMIMAAQGLLSKNPNPTDVQILEHMQSNVCRCGCYPRIVSAIKRAAKAIRTEAGK